MGEGLESLSQRVAEDPEPLPERVNGTRALGLLDEGESLRGAGHGLNSGPNRRRGGEEGRDEEALENRALPALGVPEKRERGPHRELLDVSSVDPMDNRRDEVLCQFPRSQSHRVVEYSIQCIQGNKRGDSLAESTGNERVDGLVLEVSWASWAEGLPEERAQEALEGGWPVEEEAQETRG